MQKNVLIIVAPENFRDEELFVPQKILEEVGVTTTIASTQTGICRGKLGGEVEAVIGLNQVNVEDFDATIFVGGSGSQIFLNEPAALLIVQKVIATDKILAAICAAPTILATAGVLKNRKVTVFPDPSYEEILVKNGANLTRKNLEIDGKIITANDAPIAEKFGEKVVELLKK